LVVRFVIDTGGVGEVVTSKLLVVLLLLLRFCFLFRAASTSAEGVISCRITPLECDQTVSLGPVAERRRFAGALERKVYSGVAFVEVEVVVGVIWAGGVRV
tara:strand:+ start:356 stop:658 length:303 start_codon:yes stop_codon:yes gene_type:complete